MKKISPLAFYANQCVCIKYKKTFLRIKTLLFIAPFFLLSPIIANPKNLGKYFADRSDYYRAATEYQRAAFQVPLGAQRNEMLQKSAEQYFFAKQYNQTLGILRSLPASYPSLWLSYFSYKKMHSWGMAGRTLDKIYYLGQRESSETGKLAKKKSIQYEKNLITLMQEIASPPTLQMLDSIVITPEPPKGLGYPFLRLQYPQEILDYHPENKRKSILLAGLLSSIIPGAGHWYADEGGTGITTFGIVGFLGALGALAYSNGETLTSFVSWGLAGTFYLGGIYGGIQAARKKNALSIAEYNERLALLGYRYTGQF